jgi:hypothetical protein
MQNLSNTQKEELRILNERLLKLQEKIIKEAIKIDMELSKRVANKEDVLDDYEIELEINFILKEDDKEFKEDDDNFITVILEYLKGISKKSDNYPWKLEDNHNDFRACKNHPMQNEYHCWWFHCLYDHNHLSWKDMLRIGEFWSDLKVKYQYFDKGGDFARNLEN